MFGVAWWSLKLRWFAAHAVNVSGRTPPRIRIFVLYHDPASLPTVPDSHGLQKGLMGVVHGFAMKEMTGNNSIVIAHELMHTLGATDKYDFATGAPLYPSGFAEPDRNPCYPQPSAEIMAGRRRAHDDRIRRCRQSAQRDRRPHHGKLEIRWTHPEHRRTDGERVKRARRGAALVSGCRSNSSPGELLAILGRNGSARP